MDLFWGLIFLIGFVVALILGWFWGVRDARKAFMDRTWDDRLKAYVGGDDAE